MVQEVAEAFDALARDYDAWYDREPLLFSIEVAAVRELCPVVGSPALEVGVGSGRFAAALGVKVGVDPSLALLKLGRGAGVTGVQGVGEAVPFRGDTFCTVFVLFALCFMKRPLDVVKECRRILRPGGQLLVADFNSDSAWGTLYEDKKNAGHALYRHATLRSPADVKNLLFSGGFNVEGSVSTLMQRPGQVASIEHPTDGFVDGAGVVVFLARK